MKSKETRMVLTQQTFFGASIRSFSSSIGWNNQVSQCTVNLVEDTKHGDVFSPEGVGSPAYFSYEGFSFGGIVSYYKTLNSTGGYPVYEVGLIDPREFLDGVQLILDGFNGTVIAIPNLYNIYAYYENASFGSSLSNPSGMPWSLVVNALYTLIATNPIQFKNYIFYLDINELPTMPDHYRVGADGVSMSLMEFVSRICGDSGTDFFFTLVNVNGQNTIKLRVVTRYNQPDLGAIPRFIASTTAGLAVSSEYGAELRNDTSTSKFLIGGNVESIYLQTPVNGDEDTFDDDTIIQFLGTDEFGNVIIPTPTDDGTSYTFSLPSRLLNVAGVGETYPTSQGELRAALGGQSSWEAYLWSRNSDETSVHFEKAGKVGLLSDVRQDFANFLAGKAPTEEAFRALEARDLAPFTGWNTRKSGDILDPREANVNRLYNWIHNYAEEFYGKKFLVRIPFVFASIEPETNIYKTSVEPTESGYLDESQFPVAIDSGYLPPEVDRLTTPESKIECYVRFDNIIIDSTQLVDISEISPEEVIWSYRNIRATQLEINEMIEDLGGTPPEADALEIGEDGGEDTYRIAYAFIKADIDPTVYFLDRSLAYSPRVVVTIPGKIMPIYEGNDFVGILRDVFTDHLVNVVGLDRVRDKNKIKADISQVFSKFGSEQLMFGSAGVALLPDLAGVPLKSNIETYGPWYVLGAIGRSDFTQETSLVPWNYGGFEIMNEVANAMVSEGLTFQQQGETGSIEFPGVPAISLGDLLITSGPYVTNINVSIDNNGVTTSYKMETWVARFGKLAKSNIERLSRLSKVAQTNRRLIRNITKFPGIGNRFYRQRESALLKPPPRRSHHTSHTYLCGETFTNTSGNIGSNVVLSSPDNMPTSISVDYDKKAFVSLDGMFRPFSTNPSVSGIAHFETPTTSGTGGRSVTELNPYTVGTDIKIFAKSSGLAESEALEDLINQNDNRALALRGPLVISGWGFDTNGKPVPNSNENSPTTSFLTDYLQKSDQWKTGPLDVRWSTSRKVWVASNSSSFRVARLTQNLVGGSFASGVLLTPTINSTSHLITAWTEESGAVRIYDGFEYSYPATPSGARVYIQKEESSSEWFMSAAGVV